jgi:hypothetical protein
MNATMEQYIWVFFDHQQDSLVLWLNVPECATNNGTSESTNRTPLYSVPGLNLWMLFGNTRHRNGNNAVLMHIRFKQLCNKFMNIFGLG